MVYVSLLYLDYDWDLLNREDLEKVQRCLDMEVFRGEELIYEQFETVIDII